MVKGFPCVLIYTECLPLLFKAIVAHSTFKSYFPKIKVLVLFSTFYSQYGKIG